MKKTKSNKVGLKNTQSIDNYEQSIKKRPNTDPSIHENTPTKKNKGHSESSDESIMPHNSSHSSASYSHEPINHQSSQIIYFNGIPGIFTPINTFPRYSQELFTQPAFPFPTYPPTLFTPPAFPFPTYPPTLFTQPILPFPTNIPTLSSQPLYSLPGQIHSSPSQSEYSNPIPSSSSGYKRVYSSATKTITWQPVNSSLLENSQALTQVAHTDSESSDSDHFVVVNTPNKQDIIFAEKTYLKIECILNEIATTDLLKKLCRNAKGYPLKDYSIDSINKEKFILAITSIIDMDSVDLVENEQLSVSTNTINKYLNQFQEAMESILLPNENKDRNELIVKFFVRVFSIKLVNVIREYNISISDAHDVTDKKYSDTIEKIYNYQRTVNMQNDLFILEFNPNAGSIISNRFIIDELNNTPKGKKKSNQETWNSDSELHMSIFPALEKFMTKTTQLFMSKHIVQQINRRSSATHFRPTSVIDIYYYLVQEKIINENTPINFFDSSIGWLDRLTAALLCAKGQAFKSYVGFDPNPKVITAGNQLVAGLKSNYNPNFNVQLYQEGIETVDSSDVIKRNGGCFSFAFTSPPFFAAQEKYGINGDNEKAQVWKLYTTLGEYKNKFLRPLLQTNFNVLTAGGVFGLHFKEEKLLKETLELVNKDINNESMKMQIWQQGIYYPKGQKTCTEAIYLFRRPNRIEEIPYLIPDTFSAEQEIQQRVSSSAGSSLAENAVSAHKNKSVNTTSIYIDSSMDFENSESQPCSSRKRFIEDYDGSFTEKDTSKLVLNQVLKQRTVLAPKQNSSVSVSNSRNAFFSLSAPTQSSTNIKPALPSTFMESDHTQTLR